MKERVLDYLQRTVLPKNATEIGVAMGKSRQQAASSVQKHLKQLMEENLVFQHKIKGKKLYTT